MGNRAKSGAPPIVLIFFQDIITSLSGIMIFLTLLMAVDVASHHEFGLSGPVPVFQNNETALQTLRNRVAALREAIKHLSLAGLTNSDPRRALANATQAIHEEKRQQGLMLEQEDLRREIERLESELEKTRQEAKLSQTEQQELESRIRKLDEALAKALQDRGIAFIPESGIAKTPLLVECSGTTIRAGFLTRAEAPSEFSTNEGGIDKFMSFASARPASEEYFVLLLKPSAAKYGTTLAMRLKEQGYDVGYDALEEDRSISFARGQ